MGVHPNITAERFPEQGSYHGRRATVVFDYDIRNQFPATVIRDDAEAPGLMILRLDDGRVVLSTECQWHPGACDGD